MFDESFDKSNLHTIVRELALYDMNIALYRHDSEEMAKSAIPTVIIILNLFICTTLR